MSQKYFQKEETLKRVMFSVDSYRMICELSNDPQWHKLLSDNILELELLKNLPDDRNFCHTRIELLTKHNILKP
jgi:hypothetical protein